MRAVSPSSPSIICLVSSLFLFLFASVSLARQTLLNRGASLSVEDEFDLLTSPDKSFTSGFYNVGTNAYCFAIWFTHSADKTVVWTANRDKPVNGRGSRVSLQRDGNLVLIDADGSTIWNANTSSTDAAKLNLLNTGNLVVEDRSGKILWQSFDYPTDTLLPLQAITKSKKLISAKANNLLSSGYFSLFFDNDNILKLIYDGPEISSLYWPNPDYDIFQNGRTNYNSSRYGALDEMGHFLSSDKLEFSASDWGLRVKRRLTLGHDGNLRLYSLNKLNSSWLITWEALLQPCDVHGLCGRNGICLYTPILQCSCPVGFEMSDASDWSKGCKRKSNVSRDLHEVEFRELPHTDFYGFDLDFKQKISLETCRNICLVERFCEAFGYRLDGSGFCYIKSALFNGYNSPSFHGSIYLKLPRNAESSESTLFDLRKPSCKPGEVVVGSSDMYKSSTEKKYVYFYWFLSAIGTIEIIFIGWGWWHLVGEHGLLQSLEDGYQAISNRFRSFTYVELKKATKKFKEELGRGGSGIVYKGVLADKRIVAVKKLADATQGEEEFWAEVSTIGKIYHMNLVRMWGYCAEAHRRLLIYEYVDNGSLAKHLFSGDSSGAGPPNMLEWHNRFKIAVGSAKGLAYLHHECLEWVIHCDVKPENILLDADFEPKIADFGLAKLSQRGGSDSSITRIRGTKGYMAPEWALNLPITAKVDVYSYGIVLLELVKGSRVSDWVVDGVEEEIMKRFVALVKQRTESGEVSWVCDLVDPRLNGQFNPQQAAVMVEVGLACVEEERSKRPTMDTVVQSLLECEDRDISFESSPLI